MIASFLSSWALFAATYLAGWLMAVLLSLVGVIVVARGQIFVGAAVAQASTLGIALAMAVGGWTAAAWLESDTFLTYMGVGFSILAALLTARPAAPGGHTHEAVTGWVFLAAASVSVLLVAHSPHGLEEIHRLVASSIIGATAGDVEGLAVLALLGAGFLWWGHERVLLLVMDPVMAAAVGMRTAWWELGGALWLGLTVGLSITVAGMLYAFGCLVLPALAARNLCREVRSMFVVAPALALAAAVAGFVFANHYDYPPAQMTVALLCAIEIAAWAVWRVRPEA
jgi:ABC-type Mn2+/Zn2+ transport system permease subunit